MVDQLCTQLSQSIRLLGTSEGKVLLPAIDPNYDSSVLDGEQLPSEHQ